jgi:hypothetical protein
MPAARYPYPGYQRRRLPVAWSQTCHLSPRPGTGSSSPRAPAPANADDLRAQDCSPPGLARTRRPCPDRARAPTLTPSSPLPYPPRYFPPPRVKRSQNPGGHSRQPGPAARPGHHLPKFRWHTFESMIVVHGIMPIFPACLVCGIESFSPRNGPSAACIKWEIRGSGRHIEQVQPCRSSNQVTVRLPRRQPHRAVRTATSPSPRPSSPTVTLSRTAAQLIGAPALPRPPLPGGAALV